MKTVLMPAYSFPPLNNGGTFRLVKFAKYLPHFGWEPVVVAPLWNEENCSLMYDPSLAEMDLCETIRVPYDRSAPDASYALSTYMRRIVFDNELQFGELPSAMLHTCRGLLQRRRINAILASSQQRFLHRITNRLHREFGTPWIADHRDIEDQERLLGSAPIKHRLGRIQKIFWETWFTRNAAAVTTVSLPLAEKLQARNRATVSVIMNGYDPDDYVGVQRRTIYGDKFKIVYTGSFYGRSNVDALLDGLDLLCMQSPMLAGLVQVWFYGKSSFEIKDQLKDHDCARLIHSGGAVPHKEAIQAQSDAQVVYLISHPSKGIVTGKIFEYLNSGTPILSVPGDGDITDQIIAETCAGKVCRNKQEVCQQLRTWMQQWKDHGSIPVKINRSALEPYSRRNQAGQMAALLDRIVRD